MTRHQLPRRLPLGVALIVLAALVAGCAGGPITAGWAGMTADGENLYIAFRERVYAFTGGGIPVTNAPEEVADPAWGPNGDKVAYARKVDGYFQIFVQTFGGDVVQLTDDARDHRKPSFSPDGNLLVYTAADDLWVLNVSDSEAEPARLTNTAAVETDPDWSPEGGLIAYVSDEAGNFDIYTIRSDGSDVQRLTSTTADERQPTWSPDGSLLAYVADLYGSNDIFTIRASGEGRTQITEDPADDLSPSWSADGAYLLFASNRNGNYDIYRVVANGTNLRQITDTEEDEIDPTWQPGGPDSSGDRGTIIYQAQLTEVPQLFATSADQSQSLSQPSWAYPSGEADQLVQFYAPPAPDGDRLYIAGFDRRIHAVNLADGTPVLLDRTDDEGNRLPWQTEQLEDIITDRVTVGAELIYVGVSNRNVLAFRKDAPDLVWTFDTGHGVWGSPRLVDGVLYITSLDHHMYAVDAQTGEKLWETEGFDGAVPGRPTFDRERGVLYVGTLTGKVLAVDASSGEVARTFEANDWVWGSPVLYEDILYFADMSGWVYALNPGTWELLWSEKVAEGAVRGSVLVTERMIFAGAADNKLYARNRLDGSRLWTQETSGPLLSDPVWVGNVVVVSPQNANYLIAAYNDTGELQWIYPPAQPGQ